MKRKNESKELPVRNFVAKNAKSAGAGRHNDAKNDYRRQPKHRNKEDPK